MFRKIIAKEFGYPIQDFVKKTEILKTLKFLNESQYWDDNQIEEYRLIKFKKLFEFARRNVPYYSELFGSLKLTFSDFKSLQDINKIPILTKEIVRKENHNLVARNFNMKHVKKGKTGGTTGAPIIVLKDVNNRSFTWASYYRWYNWIGIDYYDKEATFWGARTVLSSSLKHNIIKKSTDYLQNNLAINSFNVSNKDLSKIYMSLRRFKPQIIKGYLSALIHLAEYIEYNDLETISPIALSSTSETLYKHNREFLESVFKAPIYDQYGCGELSAISYECPKHNGLHINQEHVICEVLDEDNQAIINKSGRIVGTDLDNYVMPFIRYENGDLATLTDRKCSCGVNQPLMYSIEGRSTDTITLKNGSKVHGVFFTDILYELGIMTDIVQRFQVYQNIPGSIEFRIESRGRISSELKKSIRNALNTFFEEVDIIETNQLSVSDSGKFKYILNDIKNN